MGIIGGGTNGVVDTQGATFNNATLSTINAPGCGVANGVDTTANGLCASAGTIAGKNGETNSTVANGATAYGAYATAADANTTAIGFRATAKFEGSVAIGYQARAVADPATAIGWNSLASGNNSVALGANASAIASNAVALGANSIADQPNTVSVGAPGAERRITNVAPGVSPTDAVNVAQLQGVELSVASVARIAYSGIAMVGALAGLPQVPSDKGVQLGAGISNYAGYVALAIGGSARVTENSILKFGASTSGGSRVMFNAAMGYSW